MRVGGLDWGRLHVRDSATVICGKGHSNVLQAKRPRALVLLQRESNCFVADAASTKCHAGC